MIYPKRYTSEPRKRKAYCEACDMIAVYGIKRNHWNYKAFDISRSEMKEIWSKADADMNGNSAYDRIFTGKKSR